MSDDPIDDAPQTAEEQESPAPERPASDGGGTPVSDEPESEPQREPPAGGEGH